MLGRRYINKRIIFTVIDALPEMLQPSVKEKIELLFDQNKI